MNKRENQEKSIDALKQQLKNQETCQRELSQEAWNWQDKYIQTEQLLASVQEELASTQALVKELMPLGYMYQHHRDELVVMKNKCQQEQKWRQKDVSVLLDQLTRLQEDNTKLAEENWVLIENSNLKQQEFEARLNLVRRHAHELKHLRLEYGKVVERDSRVTQQVEN